MIKTKNTNRNKRRAFGKKGVALAILLAMTLTAMPMSMINVNAATSSSTYVQQASATFTFTDSGVTSSTTEECYEVDDSTDLKITESGTYIITGSCSEGSVTVKKGVTGVTLILKDLTLASSTGAPIAINKNNTDTTIVISGTNTLTDNENPNDEESTDADVADAFDGACIKLKSSGSLLITGDGTLNLVGTCKNGIKGADGSTITIGNTATDTFTLNVTAANDGISGDGAEGVAGLEIIGGNINVSAVSDGIKSDYILNIGQSGSTNGATINVTNSEEGFEGATVNLYGGTANIVSTDDGINAANSDLTDYSYELNVYGGTWTIDAGGDGLDSNGDLNISGGVTDISSGTASDECALDCGDTSSMNITGGTLIGIGQSGMQQGFTTGNYVMFSANISAGNTVAVKDSSGNTLYSTTAKKAANSVIFSSEDLTDGGSYTLYVNGSAAATATEGTSSQGGFGPGGQDGQQPGQDGQQPGQDGQQPGQDGDRPDGTPPGQDGTTPTDSSSTDGSSSTDDSSSTDTSEAATVIQAQTDAVYRMYNPNSGEHFYTENVSEARSLYTAGWDYESVAFSASNASTGSAVYRLYNPNAGDHHYTTNAAEAVALTALGWNNEGIAFYTESSGGTSVYRVYNPNATAGAHHYTSDYNEYVSLSTIGWEAEGVAWYTK